MDLQQLSQLPSPFYRVTVKAVILDDQKRILVGRGEADTDDWEIPGGGFEYNESLEECVKREIAEELGAEVSEVGDVLFVYRGRSKRGWMILRIGVLVKLKNYDFKYGDMTDSMFVTQAELMKLKFDADEGTIRSCVRYIWPD